MRTPPAKQMSQGPDPGAGTPVSMGDGAAGARGVEAVASVSMGINATNAKSVVEKESVTTDDDAARTARSAVAVRSGSEKNQTVTMILQNRKRVSLHRLGS